MEERPVRQITAGPIAANLHRLNSAVQPIETGQSLCIDGNQYYGGFFSDE